MALSWVARLPTLEGAKALAEAAKATVQAAANFIVTVVWEWYNRHKI